MECGPHENDAEWSIAAHCSFVAEGLALVHVAHQLLRLAVRVCHDQLAAGRLGRSSFWSPPAAGGAFGGVSAGVEHLVRLQEAVDWWQWLATLLASVISGLLAALAVLLILLCTGGSCVCVRRLLRGRHAPIAEGRPGVVPPALPARGGSARSVTGHGYLEAR